MIRNILTVFVLITVASGASLRAADCRKATCPPGFTNTGVNCVRPIHFISTGTGRPADCPTGYINIGAMCFRWKSWRVLGTGSMTCKAGEVKRGSRCYTSCPAGYTHTGISCFRDAKVIDFTCLHGEKIDGTGRCCKLKSCRMGNCPSGFNYARDSCHRPSHELPFEEGRIGDCPAGFERKFWNCYNWSSGSRPTITTVSCKPDEFRRYEKCYKKCPEGYKISGDAVHSGTKCFRASATIPLISCPSGYTRNGETCKRPYHELPLGEGRIGDCPTGFERKFWNCYNWSTGSRPAITTVSCKTGEFRRYEKCYKNCPEGYKISGDAAHSGAKCVRVSDTKPLTSIGCKTHEQPHLNLCCSA